MNLFSEEIGNGSVRVLKRGGNHEQDFDLLKIENAILKAFEEVGTQIESTRLAQLAKMVKAKILLYSVPGEVVQVEAIQDLVETTLLETKYIQEARAYILYRSKHQQIREDRLVPDPFAVANYIHPGKYARYLPEEARREVYPETVDRVTAMHIKRFPHVEEEIRDAFDFVSAKRVLPSMRSMQFAGEAIETVNARQYNCSFMHVDKMRAFGDTLYLLLCGTGVGYSIQYDHVEKLPCLKHVDHNNVRHHNIADTIEGWANALTALMNSYVRGYYVEFNYSKIRAKGVALKTSGGKAPGHLGLKNALESIRALMDKAQGRHLRPIECYDIMCHAADAVLSGGIRRSATIALFSLDDGEMMAAKTGNWFDIYPWRTNANNSAVLKRGDVKKKQFKRIFKYIQEFGEPGFVFTNDYDYGFNPCVEINLNPVLTVDEQALEHIELKRAQGYSIPKVKIGDRLTGVAWCNLTEINAAAFKTPEDMYAATVAAARIGTLQAAYTSFPYLGWVSEVIAEREALLGVSMTGMLDAPDIALNPEYQKEAALRAVAENKRFAEKLGIRNAARVTCVKPAGTTSLELGCVASGHHAHHARRYIRRVTANELEPVFQYFKEENEHMCQKKDNGDWVIEFPVVAPEGAIVQDDLTALEFLEMVRSTQQNWVVSGIADPDRSPGACHNVSNTVVCKPEEWQEVAEYVWEHRKDFSGISFLPSTGDKDFAFAPRESISTEADEEKWNHLLRHYTPVDYTKMVETGDNTDLTGELVCSGGKCEI